MVDVDKCCYLAILNSYIKQLKSRISKGTLKVEIFCWSLAQFNIRLTDKSNLLPLYRNRIKEFFPFLFTKCLLWATQQIFSGMNVLSARLTGRSCSINRDASYGLLVWVDQVNIWFTFPIFRFLNAFSYLFSSHRFKIAGSSYTRTGSLVFIGSIKFIEMQNYDVGGRLHEF